MDDIVVIILTLVVALFGILNKKKKKTTSAPSSPGTPNQSPNFWDMIMDGGKAQEENVPEYEELEPIVEKAEEPRIKPKYQFSTVKEGRSDIEKKTEKVVKPKRKVMIEGEAFSLKKAVIYNEILNRKYS